MKKFIYILVFGLLSFCSFGQVGNVGSWPPDYELMQKCVDSADLGTNYISYYEIRIMRAGQADSIKAFRANGNAFTVPSGKQTIGDCPGQVTVTKDSIREFDVLEMCDSGSPFLRLIQRTYFPGTNTSVIQKIADLSVTLAPYTVSGTITSAPCFSTSTTPLITSFDTETTSTIGVGKISWMIHNKSTSIITVSIDGQTNQNLHPGQYIGCNAQTNASTNKYITCPGVTINATSGNPVSVIYR
jgi:hypothetical protein